LNAFLLAAGLGTRLRPLTDEIPKCLVEICGKPLLQWWLEKLEDTGIRKVLINTHHLPNQVEAFAGSYKGNIDIILFYEERLLGSAGTVRANREFIENDDFLIVYADNLTDIKLDGIIKYHLSKKPVMTMGVMEMPRPETRGIAVPDENGVIVEFIEKSANPPGKLANAGIKVASPKLYDYLQEKKVPLDFGFDIFPKMVGKMHSYELSGYLQDIGNPADLKSARESWMRILQGRQHGILKEDRW